MRVCDIIEKKAARGELNEEEIQFFLGALCAGSIPDYQTSALLMAIFLNGMTERELARWTLGMARSGDLVDLSAIGGVKVDKHSTGGIGDKTTVILGPIVAACGGKLAKMSGRGLGFSGGTIDKLESLPGFNTALSQDEFIRLVNTVGMAVTGQTASVALADKKLYALRDVTATVNSIPLIASSIMSKKLASGADKIVLDVKVGSGAFMKTMDDARKLAAAMVSIGEENGRETAAILTNMDRPLGRRVGNLLEMQEAYETLQGRGPADLTELCLWLSARMLSMAGLGDFEACRKKAEASIENGAAAAKFREFVTAQGGDLTVLDHPEAHYPRPLERVVTAAADGYFRIVSAEAIGRASVSLGAGRVTKEDAIDFTAGIVLEAASGDRVVKGQPLFRLCAAAEARLEAAAQDLAAAYRITEDAPEAEPLILDVVDRRTLAL
ncbi:MAG: thymidine phosphorylase [Oscillospiraceae bacterium]|nr:thymidine phosphorylase [Oscillospiraceae bacterium]